MIIKKLPSEIQSILNACAKINNYKDAIEELVYNSLDADATSVVIRIHIYENIIQVIDNGFGITKYDIPLLGQRYASSKVTDASSLKNAPVKFGFRGESLTNIIEVSQCVKITTRHKDTDETWVKCFYKGQPKHSQITSMRPSKGTTVEVKGFLYNLHIQKKLTNPLIELQSIKLFLQQISLVNTNVSISLRDNSKNEIIFKLHKNRDVYQTLSSLYGINKTDLQELQIEKHQYKAKGFIGKQNMESTSYRWIYLNGRFVHNCALHDIINSNLSKNNHQCRNVKTKNNFHNFEKKMQNENEVPTYFIFITCPHLDYDINITLTKTIIEFKDWIQIRQLLEKLVQFYKGDIKLKKIDMEKNERTNKVENTREEVRKIIEKILGNKTKNQRISQLHKSVKGKIAKKKKTSKCKNIQQFKNIHRSPKETMKIDNNLNLCMEKPSSVINKVPVNINFQLSTSKCFKTKHEIENDHGIVKKKLRSKKEKQKNKTNPIQENEKDKKTVDTNNKEKTDCHSGSPKDITHIVIHETPLSNQIQTRNPNREKRIINIKKTKTKQLKSKNEKRKLKSKQNIDSRIKKYLKEKAFKLNCENFKKKMNETPHNNYIKADEMFFENRNNINSFHEHKNLFTVNDVANLEKDERDFIKSSDLLNTILNSQRGYSCFNDLRFQNPRKPIEKDHGQNTALIQNKSSEKRNYCNVVNNTDHDENVQESSNNFCIYKHAGRFQTKKFNHIGRDIDHYQITPKLTLNLDQHYRPDQSISYFNNIETNISTTHVYRTFPKLTFESHKYNLNDVLMKKNKKFERFISEQSKENFNLHNIKHTFNVTSNNCKSNFNHPNFGNKRQNLRKHPNIKSVKTVPYFEHKSSHIIEFSNNWNNRKQSETLDRWKCKITGNMQNTYTILDSNVSLDITSYLNNINKNTVHQQDSLASYLRWNLNENDLIDKEKHGKSKEVQDLGNAEMQVNQTDDHIEPIDFCEAVYHKSNDDPHSFNMHREITIKDDANHIAAGNKTDRVYENDSSYKNNKADAMSRYFLTYDDQNIPNNKNSSEQYCGDKDTRQLRENNNFTHVLDEEIDNHFKTIQSHQTLQRNESKNLINDQSNDKETMNNENQTKSDLCPNITRVDDINYNVSNEIILAEEISCLQTNKNNENLFIDNCVNSHNKEQFNKDGETRSCNEDKKTKHNYFESVVCESISNLKNNENLRVCDFKIQNRLSFVPKGMSPIFDNCNNKNICSYNLETDYYQDDVYNNFATEILENVKIFENKISNMNNISEKLNTVNNCLKFDAESLKNAKVFGQVDRKFIVAEVQSDDLKHLVLFDQHAVHERIRLEKNLSDYKDGDQWNSINCETLSLTLSEDTVLYLNNFRDKFRQLGLEWKMESDCSVTVNAIPKAVFGKNYRQADVIIHTIKKLILEEIKAIKSLGGNSLLYPKSIMDLVFSEACRHAIKFGDKLSKRECATLISSLSSCKTPFQCAHGRPVLAVLSDLRAYNNEYKVDASKILSFRNKFI